MCHRLTACSLCHFIVFVRAPAFAPTVFYVTLSFPSDCTILLLILDTVLSFDKSVRLLLCSVHRTVPSFGNFVRSNCFSCYSAAPIGLYLLSVDLFDLLFGITSQCPSDRTFSFLKFLRICSVLLCSSHRTVPSLSENLLRSFSPPIVFTGSELI